MSQTAGDVEQTTLSVGNSRIEVQISGEWPRMQRAPVINWVKRSATSVSKYYGHFPVKTAVIKVNPFWGQGFRFATTDSENGSGVIEIPVGDVTSQNALNKDWVLTHEMVHLAFPLVYPQDRWLVEGMATYIEPLARMQAGYISKEQVWGDLVSGLPKGLPGPGDQGLDNNHSWGRTYWGGALFCLLADIELRRATGNKKGLQDALQAIDRTAGNINNDIEVIDALKAGDRSIGGGKHVLQNLYFKMKNNPVTPDLDKIWTELGVIKKGETITFDDSAPLSSVRLAIDGSRRTNVATSFAH